MKIHLLTCFFLLCYLTGCTQKDTHNYHQPGKIPIDPKRWYILNNAANGLDGLFNNKANDNMNAGWGMILGNYNAYYPILPGEKMAIDSIYMYDGEGSFEDEPMTIFAILKDWQKIPIAVFKGNNYNQWVGPYPDKPNVYVLEKPIADIQYLVINTYNHFPTEIEFYGTYTAPIAITQPIIQPAPLKNFFGVNAFEWDFEDAKNPAVVDPQKLALIKNFTGFRHYMDWQKLEPQQGVYTFNPVDNGNWNYDALYQTCKENNITVLSCLKTIPDWLQETYPENERNNENIPMAYGKKASDPHSYLEQAQVAFQFAARYGKNKNIDNKLIKLGHNNEIKTGLGLIDYIECDNERDKWWKGRQAYQTGREYAANLSAFYDGNKNTMGPGVGIKNADPAMQVVMAGLAAPNTDYVKGMIDWCKEYRGYKPDGTVYFAWDIINYHFYANDAFLNEDKKQKCGLAPEKAGTADCAQKFIDMAHQYANDMPVWVTEAGYDINAASIQRAPSIKEHAATQTQADWILRTSLLYAKTGIQKVFYYELNDDNTGNDTKYATSGLIEYSKTRPVADYLYQTNQLFGAFVYNKTLSSLPVVDKYIHNHTAMYMLVMPTQEGKTQIYTLDLGKATNAYIYKPAIGATKMKVEKKTTVQGKIAVDVTETPVFITTEEQ